MKKLIFPVTILIVLLGGTISFSQPTNFTKSDYWYHQRKEFLFGAGVTSLLGDLGGDNKPGKNYSPTDIDWTLLRPVGHIGYRYRFSNWFSTKSVLQYGILRADDALTNWPERHYRDLNVRTHLIEFSQQLELIIIHNEQFGNRFKLGKLKGMHNKNNLIYLFSGISVFAYIPQGKGEGGWTNLRPLHTEGQGLQNGPKQYKLVNVGIPMGLGWKIGLNLHWRMTFELSYTKTFTDYLDDVSGLYYSNFAISEAYGETAASYADPSSGAFNEWTSPGTARGNSAQKDGYILFNVSLVRNITYKNSKQVKLP